MTFTWRQLIELVSFPLVLATGQILFKRAALQIGIPQGASWVLDIVRLPTMWVALLLYGAATLLWVRILTTVPLSRAYVFAALAFVIVPAAGYFLFDEAISTRFIVGTLMIVAGVMVAAQA
jgi:undecaprenyl phosphate-alpha-L-ara4N flippase subunit ArnE